MPPVAKQRRNRERATELITVLDGMVPAKYPYRAFSKQAVGAELSLQKRSRNMTLEDVIDAVRNALGKGSSKAHKHRSEQQVSISSVMCSSNDVFGVAILREDGEIVEASECLKRMLGMSYIEQKRAFIRSGEWITDELAGTSTCQVPPDGMPNAAGLCGDALAARLGGRGLVRQCSFLFSAPGVLPRLAARMLRFRMLCFWGRFLPCLDM